MTEPAGIAPQASEPRTPQVSIYSITQATAATFADLYFRQTFLFFIQLGSKRASSATQGEIIGEEGDLMIFPPGSMVTMENRPVLDDRYRAVGVSFSDELIEAVFAPQTPRSQASSIQVVRAEPQRPADLLAIIQDTVGNTTLPEPVRNHRLLEPLIWLRHHGYHVPTQGEERPLSRVRRLIETDLAHNWRMADIADSFATSEATLRRSLAKSGQGFAKILLNTRLENGLALLQTTDVPISHIALDCGFKTPSHFADAFKNRFGITPRQIRTAGN